MKKSIILLLILSSCGQRSDNKSVIEPQRNDFIKIEKENNIEPIPETRAISPELPLDSVKDLIKRVKEGDIEAYKMLSFDYHIKGKAKDLYPYAKLIADRYSLPEAYYDVYSSILELNISRRTDNKIRNLIELDKCSKKEKEIAIKYLVEAY